MQCQFGVQMQVPGQADQGEQGVPQFLGRRAGVAVVHRLLQLGQFLVHLGQHAVHGIPVEAHPSGFLGDPSGAVQGG